MLYIIAIGVVAQILLQYAVDTSFANFLLSRTWSHRVRYLLATNFPFKIVWNILSGIPIALIIGASGLYASIIFLVSNFIYEIGCRVWLYHRWKRQWVEFTSGRGAEEIAKAEIRRKIEREAAKEKVILYEEDVQALVEAEFKLNYNHLAQESEKQRRKKSEFMDRLQRGVG